MRGLVRSMSELLFSNVSSEKISIIRCAWSFVCEVCRVKLASGPNRSGLIFRGQIVKGLFA